MGGREDLIIRKVPHWRKRHKGEFKGEVITLKGGGYRVPMT